MSPTLGEVERRVLGVLLEKALAQPQYYPMSLNAIIAAANQKNNRDPVMELDEGAVWDALERLRAAGLTSRLLPGGASRVERFKHEVREQLGWEKPQRAVMAELLLRGPQTVGELRGRCTRMHPFENTESVTAVLESLMEADPPMVAVLPRAAGQSATRYAHKLYEEREWAALAGAGASQATAAAAALADAPAVTRPLFAAAAAAPRATPSGDVPVAARESAVDVDSLRGEVSALRQELSDLRVRLEELERRIQGG